MTDGPRLIEVAFPLKQASLDSVHEKNVRHGHISTLHIWPARRPLAACRAALIATLLPDPGTPEKRREILERLAGKVVEKIERKKMPSGKVVERKKEETVGGILHWGRESGPDLDWFRDEIRKAYGGRAPTVLDPFAGGGAIPLEAMRLGCEATAIDINPVAWFILKCTLQYPQKLAGQKRPLPEFVLKDREFMEAFFKAEGFKGALLRTQLEKLGLGENPEPLLAGTTRDSVHLDADLAWHVRAWGKWVLDRARRDLAAFYPTYADFESLTRPRPSGATLSQGERARNLETTALSPGERGDPEAVGEGRRGTVDRARRLVPMTEDEKANIDVLNAEFSAEYLKDETNPRWVAKPTVAYLWARTVQCKNCRATIPLLKTRWLCKKDRKRVLLTMEPNAEKTGVVFGVQKDVPVVGGNAAQRREHDRRIGPGTMSRNGAWCPCCGRPGTVAMEMEDIRQEGLRGRLGAVMTAVVVDGPSGKEYRLPTDKERKMAECAHDELGRAFAEMPYGLMEEPLPSKEALGFRVPLYGFDQWYKLFTPRQLLGLGTFVKHTRAAREAMLSLVYVQPWVEAILALLGSALDRLSDYNSNVCNWDPNGEYITHTFQRFALPIKWDFSEIDPGSETTGGYAGALDWVSRYLEHACRACSKGSTATVAAISAVEVMDTNVDFIFTDPPYYDAIPYSDLMDFFYVWLRRTLHGLSPEFDGAFGESLSPKWDHAKNDGELIDDSSRFGGDKEKSKLAYENGMYRAFQACEGALRPEGRLVIVFANKQPDAWETLVSAMIRAGFVVDGSWPIQTEMGNRTRALSSAALSSSVWLVCKKRSEIAKPGWDNKVLEEMREKIALRLREFWDAGIRGPDFVWAATGPALEAYSKHPIVKKANEPGKLMEVSEFLRHVRRMVVDFVVGRVLSDNGAAEGVSGLDDVTTYYLLHRHDFGMDDAPIGACILYAVSCGLSDSALADQYEILVRTGGREVVEEDEAEGLTTEETESTEEEEGTGSKVRLRAWNQRRRVTMGEDSGGRPAPVIDQTHRLMHLWKAGEQFKVDDYLDSKGLRGNQLFHQLLQALIELAEHGSEERSILESLSNHVGAVGARADTGQYQLGYEAPEGQER
jgi:adenine-specific DNA methylase